ncbi:MAG TPA: tRNA (guanosine(37)-N1)-methyltransferase TrmD [Polyangia bacterium]
MTTSEGARLHIELVTLFPEFFDSVLSTSLLGKAIAAGLIRVDRTNFRDHGVGKHKTVDDSPYGGGPGMVLRPEPLAATIEAIEAARGPCHRIILSPQGRRFDQATAAALAQRDRIMLICGRYEGFDDRVPTLFAHDILSVGDFVLSGGEVAAAVVIEATTRLIPGVLGKNESTFDESFATGRLEYPHYTRPPEFRGIKVPDVLISGDHAAIEAWRRRESLRRTEERRPDLLDAHPLTPAENQLLAKQAKAPSQTQAAAKTPAETGSNHEDDGTT